MRIGTFRLHQLRTEVRVCRLNLYRNLSFKKCDYPINKQIRDVLTSEGLVIVYTYHLSVPQKSLTAALRIILELTQPFVTDR